MTISDGKHEQDFTNLWYVRLTMFVGEVGVWQGNYFRLASLEAAHENRWARIEEIS